MKAHLEADLEVGVFGFSTGLEYLPSGFAAAARGGVYATHMRDEGDRPIEAVTEAIEAARASGVSLQISLLITASPVAVQTLAPAEAPISLSFRSLQPGEAILAKSKADAAIKRVVLTVGDQIRALDPAVVYDLSAEGCAGDDSLRKRARG